MRMPAVLFLLTLLLATASCKRSGVTGNQNVANGNASGATGSVSSTPPYATKEPERYQAIRVDTISMVKEGTWEDLQSSQTFIARDGERRREEHEARGLKLTQLELPSGIYLLLPEKKLYSQSKPSDVTVQSEKPPIGPPDFAPNKLLYEDRPETRYEKLGAETVNGRATAKYRVTVRWTGEPGARITESLVWVDESLGMLVKSEIHSMGGATPEAKVMMELRDIKETVDAGLFDLPTDYREVTTQEILDLVNRSAAPGDGRD